MAKNPCRGCVRVGFKKERKTRVRGEFLPIPMKRCHVCIRNPKVRAKKGWSSAFWLRYKDYYLSKEEFTHDKAYRRGMGAVCDDGHGGRLLHHNTRSSYTKRERKFLKKRGHALRRQ